MIAITFMFFSCAQKHECANVRARQEKNQMRRMVMLPGGDSGGEPSLLMTMQKDSLTTCGVTGSTMAADWSDFSS